MSRIVLILLALAGVLGYQPAARASITASSQATTFAKKLVPVILEYLLGKELLDRIWDPLTGRPDTKQLQAEIRAVETVVQSVDRRLAVFFADLRGKLTDETTVARYEALVRETVALSERIVHLEARVQQSENRIGEQEKRLQAVEKAVQELEQLKRRQVRQPQSQSQVTHRDLGKAAAVIGELGIERDNRFWRVVVDNASVTTRPQDIANAIPDAWLELQFAGVRNSLPAGQQALLIRLGLELLSRNPLRGTIQKADFLLIDRESGRRYDVAYLHAEGHSQFVGSATLAFFIPSEPAAFNLKVHRRGLGSALEFAIRVTE